MAEAVPPGGLEEGQQPQPHPTAPRPDLPQVLQRLEARRQQVSEAEVAAVERQMEEARENIRKAEVGPECAQGGLEVCRFVSPEGFWGQGIQGRGAAVAARCWGAVPRSSHAGGRVLGDGAWLSPTPQRSPYPLKTSLPIPALSVPLSPPGPCLRLAR